MKRVYFLLPVVLIFCLLAGYFVFHGRGSSQKLNSASPVLPKLSDMTAQHDYWLDRVKAVGAETAYSEFKNTYKTVDFGTQHLAAHMFGALLYETAGVKGLTICDSSFAFGCFHSFFAGAIGHEGINTLSELDALCVEKYGVFGTGCQHGIGHGILEYLGHDKLTEALQECGKTTQKNPLFGCTSGVFMEYNMPLVLNDVNTTVRARSLNAENPYAPCPELPQKAFRLSCYNEIAQWWHQYFDYKKMGGLCGKLTDIDEREVCFESIGGLAAVSADYKTADIINICEELATATGKLLCRSGAAWAIYAEPSQKMHAAEACSGAKEYSTCLKKAVIICNYLKDQTLQPQCIKDNPIGS